MENEDDKSCKYNKGLCVKSSNKDSIISRNLPTDNLDKISNEKEDLSKIKDIQKKEENAEQFVLIIKKEDILKYGTPEADLIASFLELFSNQYGRNLSLSELGRIYGIQSIFTRCLYQQNSFREDTIERLENMVNNELTGDNLANGIDSINKYRRVKEYVIFDEAPNKPEIILIKSLRSIFEEKEGRELTLTELGTVTGLGFLFLSAWENRTIFRTTSIDMIEYKINQLLKDELYVKALNALDLYREERQYKKLEDLLEDPDYSNYVPELELIIILRQNFSEQIGEFLSLRALGLLLTKGNNYFNSAILYQTSFNDNTLRTIRAKVNKILKHSLRKETLSILNDYENLDKLRKNASENTSNLWKDPEYRSKQESSRQTEEFLTKTRGSAHYKWNPDRTQKVLGEHTIRFRYLRDTQIEFLLNQQLGLDGLTGKPFTKYDLLHRHHIDDDKMNDALKNLILLTANTHGTVPNSTNPKWNRYFKILSENKQDFINGVAPRNWSKEAKNLFNERQIKKIDLRDYL